MKRTLLILSIVALSALSASQAVSEEKTTGTPDEYGQIKAFQMEKKDECLIVASNCTGDADTVTQRVERLNREILKGNTVYSEEELKAFRDQLNWIQTEGADSLNSRI